jgi:hypothetical protein
MPSVGDTWVYKGLFLTAVHRHSGAFKKYSRGVRTPPIVVYPVKPVSADSEGLREFLLGVIEGVEEA